MTISSVRKSKRAYSKSIENNTMQDFKKKTQGASKNPTSKSQYTEKNLFRHSALLLQKTIRFPCRSVNSCGQDVGRWKGSKMPVSIIAVLAALDLEDDIGARSLYTTRLDFVQEYKFDHDLSAKTF